MLLAPKVVGDIPILGLALAGYALATLDVLGRRLLSAAVAADIGAYRGPGDSATGGGDILAGSAADLVTKNAANEGAGNCPCLLYTSPSPRD